MQKFFVDSSHISNGHIIADGEIGVHVVKSLRMKVGEAICFCDFESVVYECVVREVDINNATLTAEIIKSYEGDTEPSTRITLFMSLPKSDKMDLIVQKCTELGVSEIVPVISENCVVKLKDDKSTDNKLKRWNKIAFEAAVQSGRSKVPEVKTPVKFEEAIKSSGYLLKTIPYEKEDTLSLKTLLHENDNVINCESADKTIACFIGPEGGYTENEINMARDCGVFSVSLGKRILRAETAAIVTVAELIYELD